MRKNDNYRLKNGRIFVVTILIFVLTIFSIYNMSYALTDSIIDEAKKDDAKENIVQGNIKNETSNGEPEVKANNKVNTKEDVHSINITEDAKNNKKTEIESTEKKKIINNAKEIQEQNTSNTNINDNKGKTDNEVSDVDLNNVGTFNVKNSIEGTVTEIRQESNGYIIGNIRTNAKIDGSKLLLVDEAGNKSGTWVVASGNGNYYFDKNMAGMSKDKKYHFEIVIGNESTKVTIANKDLGYAGNYNAKIFENNIVYTREAVKGNITEIRQESNGYIIGNIRTNAKIDGSKLLLVDEAGNKSGTWVVASGNGNYYFDKNMAGMSKDKKYHFEIVIGNESTKVTIANKDLGMANGYTTKIIDNTLVFEQRKKLEEEIVFDIPKIQLENNYLKMNANIYKKIKYAEGEKISDVNIEKIEVEDASGKRSGTFRVSTSENWYYIDRNMNGYSNNTTYKVILTVDGKEIVATLKDGIIGMLGDKEAVVKDNKIEFEKIEVKTYTKVEYIKAQKNPDYLIMNLSFNEYIGNVKTNNEVKVEKIVLRDLENNNESKLYMSKIGANRYYADIAIGKIIKDKKYDIVAYYYENDKLVARIINVGNSEIGSTSRAKVIANGYNINFEKFDGSTRIDVENIKFFNSNGNDYLSTVFTVYLEGDNGDKKTNDISKIYLIEKGTNNSKEFWIKKLDNNRIYADINISAFDKNKKYIIKLGDIVLNNNKYIGSSLVYNSNDIGNSRFMKAKYRGNELSFEKFRFEHGVYGKSERGRDLEYYKLGNGKNVAFFTFAMHGFEDNFDHDGAVLVRIAEVLKDKLMYEEDILSKWTIYIFKAVNPDGVAEGWTRNGPGRTTVGSGIDLNRQWQIPGHQYRRYTDSRNYNGNSSFIAPEAYNLRDFILAHKTNSGKNIAIDTHGWLNGTYGDSWLGSFYRNEFGMHNHNNGYGTQYFINWARSVLPNSRSALVELPNVWSYAEAMNKSYPETHALATMKMLRSV